MSPQSDNMVKDVIDANKLATETMKSAGYFFSFIQKTSKEGINWIVLASTLDAVFKIKINSESGEVFEFGPAN